MPKSKTRGIAPDSQAKEATVSDIVGAFSKAFQPLEADHLYVLEDARTGAKYVECHVKADKLIPLGTVDVPLDPEEQPEYRANRELVDDHIAFERMKDDALRKRTFSNLVAEFDMSYDADHPLKVIGGQHRFMAIQEALAKDVNEHHGVKVYFELDLDQRFDVQLISNTNIGVSTDLFDRMQETIAGPELRDFCQEVGLLASSQDFADRRQRLSPLTVRAARTFIVDYFRCRKVDPAQFDQTETTPIICKTGEPDTDWDQTKRDHPGLWKDVGLKDAARAFAQLIEAQRAAFASGKPKGRKGGNVDFAEKAMNYAVLGAWAFVAGMLKDNKLRLQRHYSLKDQSGRDPLNAAALAKGRHKSDPENYRGLGYRTDAKERARLVELFSLQAEDGGGITGAMVELAIKKYHAKEAQLDVVRARDKSKSA